MRNFILSFLLLLLFNAASGQTAYLVRSGEKGLFLEHKVVAKENYYSIGRLYSIAPKDIAAYNAVDMNGGLEVGQVLRIPLTAANFSQSNNTGTPVYYVVGEKEGLYRVSLRNNNVLMADLRKWNKLQSDAIKAGQKLVVGFLAPAQTVATAPVADPVVQPQVTETPREKETIVSEPRTEKKVVPVATPPATQNPVRNANDDGGGGYFKKQYEQQSKSGIGGKSFTVTSGIFKTASGWQDTKYYALVDGIDPGTIIRVSNPANNKSVYAKVLGTMSGIRQNQGYDVRISNAAASVLEIGDTEKFTVKVAY